jgi:hypothetical protein
MKWLLILAALAGALLMSTAHAETLCHGPITVTANGTYPSATVPWTPDGGDFQNPDARMLVVTAGSGTGGPNAVANVWAPSVTGTSNREVHQIALLNGAISFVGHMGSAGGMSATVANCTACEVTLTFCGEVDK